MSEDGISLNNAEEQTYRTQMSHTLGGIIYHMMKMIDDGDAKECFFGIIDKDGKPITGSSDNLHAWWKEIFERDGLEAIKKFESENSKANDKSDEHGRSTKGFVSEE